MKNQSSEGKGIKELINKLKPYIHNGKLDIAIHFVLSDEEIKLLNNMNNQKSLDKKNPKYISNLVNDEARELIVNKQMTDKLKEEFYRLCTEQIKSSVKNVFNNHKELFKIIPPSSVTKRFKNVKKELLDFITKNYIPREKVEGLKMKEHTISNIETEMIIQGWNEAVYEFNHSIEEVMK